MKNYYKKREMENRGIADFKEPYMEINITGNYIPNPINNNLINDIILYDTINGITTSDNANVGILKPEFNNNEFEDKIDTVITEEVNDLSENFS